MARHSDDVLREQSDAVRHHSLMLGQTRELYAAHVKSHPNDPPGMRQALAAAFVIHARCLHKFFYPGDRPDRRDVLANDYVGNWDQVCPPKRLSDEQIRRFDTELAHLSVDRIAMPPDGYGFDVHAIYEVLQPAVETFWTNVDRALLGQVVGKALDAMPARTVQYLRMHLLNPLHVLSANTIVTQSPAHAGPLTIMGGQRK